METKDILLVILPLVTSGMSGIWSYYAANKKAELFFENELEKELHKTNLEAEKILFGERLNTYPKLLQISQDLGKENFGTPEEIIALNKKAYSEIKKWQTETNGFLLLTENSLEALYNLKEAIKAEPKKGITGYDEIQFSKIWKSRNELRGALKEDIGIKYDFNKGY